jgi:hypothetical protein
MKAREMFYVLRSKLLRLFGAGVLVMLCTGFPNGALASETHAFDPVLSLTGDCSTSVLDPVPDPGCPGGDHPASPFATPRAVATDFYGNIYVASSGPEGSEEFPKGRIVIFDSSGHYITEVPDKSGPGALAIDSEGNLYVSNYFSTLEESLVRYKPTSTYDPAAGEIEYANPPVVLQKIEASQIGIAINPLNDHLFRRLSAKIIEYKSAADGNEEVEHFGEGKLQSETLGIAVDAAHNRIYATTWQGPENLKVVRVFELAPPHNLLFTVEESAVPGGKIQSAFLSVAADEGTGHFFLYDGEGAKKVYEFDQSGTWLKTIQHDFQYIAKSVIAVDNGKFSPNGALNPTERYLYVPSHPGGIGHSFAFGPPSEGPPTVESISFSNVGEAEAELEASIEPFGLPTHYVFEYLSTQQYEEQGGNFEGAHLAGEGTIPAGNSPIDVAAAAEGLEPMTHYRFRVLAENEEGEGEGEGEFATYPAAEVFPPCPNETLRSGPSALLPDCRAYELVTPPDTNARAPRGAFHANFATREASPQGNAVSFNIEGGLIPGSEGTGSLFGDPYLSTRSAEGWSTASAGPTGAESAALLPGSNSSDQGYSFWTTGGPQGTKVIEGKNTSYVRYPDGHSELVGRGSLADDPRAQGKLISEGGTHIIFSSGEGGGGAVQLEPNAPPNGTAALYDRTADEVTHVVSLLPGDETPMAGKSATFEGASPDGKGIAFKVAGILSLRYSDEETYELGEGATFAGVAEGGNRAFYLKGGNLFRFDAETEETIAFSSSGNVTPVNVAAKGSTAYFVSPSVLTGETNPNGATPIGGQENLYRSEEGAISFVATVTERDVAGVSNGVEQVEGLGLWTYALSTNRLPADPSRSTPDGDALLFESRAVLDGYDPQGKAEVYRYDASGNELDCLSCNPTLAPASSDASLQSISADQFGPVPLGSSGYIANLRPDGKRAFFQSDEALVPQDVDGLQDVYEWEAKGTGSCNAEGGCIYLVSSGHSLRIDYLYAASDSGDDVFFRTSDILLPRDLEETPSIYDARVGGGFAELSLPICESEGCRPGVSPAPAPPNLASQASGPSGNVSTVCPKTKHKVKRHGKTVCVKKKQKHKKHHHKKKAGKSKGAGK